MAVHRPCAVYDNLGAHKITGIQTMIEGSDVALMYLLPYWPYADQTVYFDNFFTQKMEKHF